MHRFHNSESRFIVQLVSFKYLVSYFTDFLNSLDSLVGCLIIHYISNENEKKKSALGFIELLKKDNFDFTFYLLQFRYNPIIK
jgi:hypothetical protein